MLSLKKRYPTSQPLWKEWEQKAKREGPRSAVFSMNGNRYIGEWSGDKKHGKGECWYEATKEHYKGEWRRGYRSGHGTLEIPHPSGKGTWKLYDGEWKHDKFEGYGVYNFTNGDVYEGDWKAGEMCGWGTMTYVDKSTYEGEWANSKRNGLGTCIYANGDRYEGWWKDDLKHQNGKLICKEQGRIFEGYWMDDVLRCGFLEGSDVSDTVSRIPMAGLSDMNEVLKNAKHEAQATYGKNLYPVLLDDDLRKILETPTENEYEEHVEEAEAEEECVAEEGRILEEHETEQGVEERVDGDTDEMTLPSSASSSIFSDY